MTYKASFENGRIVLKHNFFDYPLGLSIHGHLANLYYKDGDANLIKTCVTRVREKDLPFAMEFDSNGRYIRSSHLKILTTYPTFDKSPVLGLFCLGASSKAIDPTTKEVKEFPIYCLETREDLTRISTAYAFSQATDAARDPQFNANLVLEGLLKVSMIVASRANGVSGSPYSLYLSHLLRELDGNASFLPSPLPLDISHSHPIFDILIPFAAPMLCKSWPRSISNMCFGQSCYPGIILPSLSNGPTDAILVPGTSVDLNQIYRGRPKYVMMQDKDGLELGPFYRTMEVLGIIVQNAPIQKDNLRYLYLATRRLANHKELLIQNENLYALINADLYALIDSVNPIHSDLPVNQLVTKFHSLFQKALESISATTITVPTVSPIIVGEYKSRNEKLNVTKVNGILRNFDTYPGCPIFLIVAKEFAEMNLSKQRYNIWQTKYSKEANNYSIKYYFAGEPDPNLRNVFLIGLKDICTADHLDVEEVATA